VSVPDPPEPSDEELSFDDFVGNMFGSAFGSMFGPALEAMKSQGTGSSAARQLAMTIATGGGSEPNVEPMVRMEYEALARVAELHVADRTGLSPDRRGSLTVEPVTRAVWAARTVDALQPLLGRVSGSLQTDTPEQGDIAPDDPRPEPADHLHEP